MPLSTHLLAVGGGLVLAGIVVGISRLRRRRIVDLPDFLPPRTEASLASYDYNYGWMP